MQNIIKRINTPGGLTDDELLSALKESIDRSCGTIKKVLLLPPDFTRFHSGAGKLTNMYYRLLSTTCTVDILPALGTHFPMTDEEKRTMFGSDIPAEAFFDHNWREDVASIGRIPGEFVNRVSDGLIDFSIEVEINKRILDKSYDLVISIGQVVPHEVVGMANYTKNVVVGCGGTDLINKSHMLGAVYGMERMMGRTDSPVRAVFDLAQEKLLKDIPLIYVLTAVSKVKDENVIKGLFIGRDRNVYEQAADLSRRLNLTLLDKPFEKVVVYLEPEEFKSTWLGNKAVYRTRMGIKTGGQLLILAPGIRQFGEDEGIDRLIGKYGYIGRDRILKLYKEQNDLKENLSVAAHLIHGSSDDRFKITYATKHLTKAQVEGVNYVYTSYDKAAARYRPDILKDGYNTMPDGEEIFYISNPALGLWALKESFL